MIYKSISALFSKTSSFRVNQIHFLCYLSTTVVILVRDYELLEEFIFLNKKNSYFRFPRLNYPHLLRVLIYLLIIPPRNSIWINTLILVIDFYHYFLKSKAILISNYGLKFLNFQLIEHFLFFILVIKTPVIKSLFLSTLF